MNFDLYAQPPDPQPSGSADGNFDVIPEAVHAILAEVQTLIGEFDDLLMQADTSVLLVARHLD